MIQLFPDLTTPEPLLMMWAVVGYVLGSIPFGLLLTRAMGLGNLREIGSGNIGTTNVLRTGSKAAAALTLILDAGKGATAVLLARTLAGEDAAQIAGLLAFLGHCFPVWLKFRGGKGVATFLGLMLALAWPVGVVCCATWLFAALLSRMSSLGALTAAIASPFWAITLSFGTGVALTACLACIVLWRHGANIGRMRAGTEPKIGQH